MTELSHHWDELCHTAGRRFVFCRGGITELTNTSDERPCWEEYYRPGANADITHKIIHAALYIHKQAVQHIKTPIHWCKMGLCFNLKSLAKDSQSPGLSITWRFQCWRCFLCRWSLPPMTEPTLWSSLTERVISSLSARLLSPYQLFSSAVSLHGNWLWLCNSVKMVRWTMNNCQKRLMQH